MANKAMHKEVEFHVGDTVRVHYKIIEKETKAGKTKKGVVEEIKERVQPFEGIVISIKGEAENKSFTVRKYGANNIGVERIFPLVSPWIEKISVHKVGHVRRAKLYYIREKAQRDIAQSLA
jgi:large subunit ribosomal protein L19